MNDFLVVYLDAIDDRLLEYLDENDELPVAIVTRLRRYVTALLDGSISPAAVAEDWPDWFGLAPAFVAAYAPDLAELEEAAVFLTAIEVDDETRLTGADRAYLAALEVRLDMYPEIRATEEE
jgi:hypothetical protein